MSDELGKQILKGVSRSFYLTLRTLPAPMRDGASLGYLLARISDTIADTSGTPAEERLDLLGGFASSVGEGRGLPVWPQSLLEGAEPEERLLLERAGEILLWLRRIDPAEAVLIREVVGTIISGQSLDLTRFAHASSGNPVTLADGASLEDYAWRVAGCVGAFWTKLGFLTMGQGYSRAPEEELLQRGIAYGKGLQLVNILRDLPRDLEAGRCYLPVNDPGNRDELMQAFRRWHRQACGWVDDGIAYAATLGPRRLRIATVLPALIAEETLEMLSDASWETLRKRVKVPRYRIYRLLAEAVLF